MPASCGKKPGIRFKVQRSKVQVGVGRFELRVFRFGIADFGFWIESLYDLKIANLGIKEIII
jgi:hypothetical protein